MVIEPAVDAWFDSTRNYAYHLGAGLQSGPAVKNNLVFPTWVEAG